MTERRALLLTDVVDSTQLSQRLGDAAMAEVWARHDRVARDLLPPWGGREIDKTDGMLLMFDGAAAALGYAQAYHRAIAALPVPLAARAGLHVGAVILRENSADDVARGAKPLEVDGLAKPTAARIMSVAQGGQTLFSTEAQADLLADAAAAVSAAAVISHGHWLMKGVSDPVELLELATPDAPLTSPPDGDKVYRVVQVDGRWLPVQQIANNLPAQASRFIGREQELREVKALLGRVRMVTLLGMGGLGKTRLSLQVAAELMHQFPDGVWFLDLAAITDPALALAEAAQMLGVREEPERTLLQSLCSFLKARRVLLIFDNCEHLVAASAQLAHALVQAAPQVRLLASSREALNIPAERSYPILPLPVPGAGDDLAALQANTAVQLFMDRAQAHKPGFTLTAQDAPAVATLVARLEGIPLALELAAARVRVLSVADINRRLDDRYKLLTGGSRVLQQRQQTLRALVDWSYDMLSQAERTLLDRLSVFRGGFDLDAVEAVCSAAPLDPLDVLDGLGALVDKSLVMRDDSEGDSRYRLLETIREYALEKLQASGAVTPLAGAHALHFFELAKRGRDGLNGPEQGLWLRRLDTELDNIRAAIARALVDDGAVDPVLALKLAVALQNFWVLRGHLREGRAAVAAALALPVVQQSELLQAHALYVLAVMASNLGDHAAALAALAPCLVLQRGLGQPGPVAATLSAQAVSLLASGDGAAAWLAAQEALPLLAAAGHLIGEATVQLQLGQIAHCQGDDVLAGQHLRQAQTLARRIKHPETEAEAELVLGQIALAAGDLALAGRHFGQALQLCQASADRCGEASARWWQGRLALEACEPTLALAPLRQALQAFRDFDMREQLLGVLDDAAALALGLGQPALAAEVVDAAEQLRRNAALPRSVRAQQRWQALVDTVSAGAAQAADQPAPAGRPAEGWDTVAAVRVALSVGAGAGAGLGT